MDYNYTSFLLQIYSLILNIGQTSNDEILKHLQKQDQSIDEQTEKYLKQIIENQEKIIKLLEKMGL